MGIRNIHKKSISVRLIAILLLGLTDASGQPKMSAERQRLSDIKISLISNRLNLSAEQSTKFWPVYNEYSVKRREIHREIRQIISYKKPIAVSEIYSSKDIVKIHQLKQNELDLDKQYQQRFLEIISVNQLGELYLTETAYRKMLLKRLKR
ncbi:hypothetical protein J2Y45_006679 [Dyadobacter sp. BE34]|uniref:Sensor of ECF-type sigma factor n=1 Tax=Dyadobacter fermentans TaxID=94254 RepID=A0ABU1R869_9BACT|nr:MULTISPECIES: hypothetical protein [Dyadobacter]MDR6809601.1 hypothetical protein [Dyadobacter fermentans]MDR7047279.1 hypothetical protein [Dyadobacter sp. BE242]MDR7201515.1 hypothetical protein [Dyadobacter sp. BE34]MDR7219385.1 hypothetical protein [Dyadobacter sp. BE31]MDR7267221.1 hypothetical protein [Dyadobacter sp. BE32]